MSTLKNESVAAIGVELGKMFIRRLDDASALIGIVAVPEFVKTEVIYPVKLSDHEGMFIANTPRDPISKYGALDNLPEMDANYIMQQSLFQPYQEPNIFDAMLRDTEIPDAPDGHKWVLVIGASKSHQGKSRTISINNGIPEAKDGEYVGEAINSIVTEGEWGNPNNPYVLASTIHFNSLEKVAQESRSRNKNEQYAEYLNKMKEISPSKSCYSKQELAFRKEASKSVMAELIDKEFPTIVDVVSAPKM